MSQSTPTTATKRKVMGRMDTAPAESPSSSLTPNARPRIIRAHHGYSSPSLSNSTTPTATRPMAGTGRARVDMSAFASPSSAASSPALSPSSSSRPVSASSINSSTITARLSGPSPSIRSTPTFPSRSGSAVGNSTPTFKSIDARGDAPLDPNLASMRSPIVRARNGSVDMSSSPSVASPTARLSANSQLSSSMSFRSPITRAEPSSQHKSSGPSTPSAYARPASRAQSRQLLSPQRSQESLERGPDKPKSRSPSPTLPAALNTAMGPPSPRPPSPTKPFSLSRQSDPIVQSRQTANPVPVPIMSKTIEPLRALSGINGSSAVNDDQTAYATSPSEFRLIGNVGPPARFEQGSAMTTSRAALRPSPALQRAAIPAAFMDLATANSNMRPHVEHRTSFASSTLSATSTSQPMSPSSETPRSPSEVAEAEEARVHRKLLDLEITNKSLMAINSALEVTKLKQAKEIRELKRRLRDGRGLPAAPIKRDSTGTMIFSDDEDLETESDDDEFTAHEDPELEAAHQRCKNLVDNMVEQARKAILAEYDEPESTGGKVLHPAELEEMRREQEEREREETEADTTAATDLLESSVTFDQSSGDTSKDDELPSSSSLKFDAGRLGEENGISASSSVTVTNGVGGADVGAQLSQTTQGLHPNTAYGSNYVPNGDVSID